VGANGDLTVAMGACTDEISYDGADGLDTSIALTGLTAGTTYIVDLVTTSDLSMYVATMCDATGPTAGNCLAHVDSSFQDESLTFTATGTSAYVIVDAGAAVAHGHLHAQRRRGPVHPREHRGLHRRHAVLRREPVRRVP
jgi:hypothetical protein